MVNNEDIMALEKSGQNLMTRVDPTICIQSTVRTVDLPGISS